MIGSKILFAYRKRLINVRLENYLEIISVFDIVFLSHITYTINTPKSPKRGGVSILDEETQSYTTAAYLIAQLGKNYSLPRGTRIPGNILLGFALETISRLKYSVGGIMEFLECKDNEFLLSFYTQNHFKPFDTRITASQNNEPHTLHQLLKFI